jgi:LPXTG-motif cell wall-anchored protein
MRETVNIIFTILMIIILLSAAGLLFFRKTSSIAIKKTGNFIPVTRELENGSYSGQFRTFMSLVRADIEFGIKDGVLTEFVLIKVTAFPCYGVDEKIASVINSSGDLNFEAITGATQSCSFVKAAIKDAIKKEQKK